MALKKNQEQFVKYLIEGKSQRQAYKAAFKRTKCSNKTIDNKACALFKKQEVRARYDELLTALAKKAEEEAIATASQVLIELTGIALGTKEFEHHDMFGNTYWAKATIPQRLKALEQLGKYHALFTERVDLTGASPVVFMGADEIAK